MFWLSSVERETKTGRTLEDRELRFTQQVQQGDIRLDAANDKSFFFLYNFYHRIKLTLLVYLLDILTEQMAHYPIYC